MTHINWTHHVSVGYSLHALRVGVEVIGPARPTNRKAKRLRQKAARRVRKRGMCELLWSTYRRQRLAHYAALERATLYGDGPGLPGLMGYGGAS